MKKRIWIASVLMLALCLNCAAAYAADRMPKGAFKDLNLTADQEKQMKTLFEGQRADEKKDFEKIRGLQGKMDEEFLSDNPNESKIASYSEEIKKIQAKLLDKQFNRVFAIRKILTPEQFRKFIEKGRKMRAKAGKDRKGSWMKHGQRGTSTAEAK